MYYVLGSLLALAAYLLWQNVSLREQLTSVEKKRQQALKRFADKLSEKLAKASEERKKYVQKLDIGGVASELNELFKGKADSPDATVPPPKSPKKA